MNRTFSAFLRYLAASGHKRASSIRMYARGNNVRASTYRRKIKREIDKGGVSADYGSALLAELDIIETEYAAGGKLISDSDRRLFLSFGNGGHQRRKFLCM